MLNVKPHLLRGPWVLICCWRQCNFPDDSPSKSHEHNEYIEGIEARSVGDLCHCTLDNCFNNRSPFLHGIPF